MYNLIYDIAEYTTIMWLSIVNRFTNCFKVRG